MLDNSSKSLGYLRYCGKSVKDGVFDARKSAQALLGFDEALRFFACYQNPSLQELDFELPVKIKQGSWEISIPEAVGVVMSTGAGIFATAYLAKAGQKMAENDFDKIGFKTVLLKSLEALQWVVRIGKHIGTTTIKHFEKVAFRNANTEIGILNISNRVLWVPEEFFDYYCKCPKYLLQKIAELVEEDRVLSIGISRKKKDVVVDITQRYKEAFLPPKEMDVFFPELVHGMEVTLEGGVTRGNEATNTMGFRYQGIILTIEPKDSSVVEYKDSLYLQAEIQGTIDRRDKNGQIALKKPKIIFTSIQTISEKNTSYPTLPFTKDEFEA